MATYTLADLEAARADLRRWSERFEQYNGNNPDKYRSDIRRAGDLVALIEADLQAAGLLARPEPTPLEALHARIDAAFPQAQSREVVEFEGKRYRRQFYPVAKSNSGKTVKEWGRTWVPLEPAS